METTVVNEMIGKTFDNVYTKDMEELVFVSERETFTFYHDRDCCEDVHINDICGDLADLEGSPLIQAEFVSEDGTDPAYESSTWTFYKFSTVKGSVTVRWFGSSNGYYSEDVDLLIERKVGVGHELIYDTTNKRFDS